MEDTARSAESRGPFDIPIDAVGKDDLPGYLGAKGWMADGQKFRWQGQGKRSLSEARIEQYDRELEELARTIEATPDGDLLRQAVDKALAISAEPPARANRSLAKRLVRAALGNPALTASDLERIVADSSLAEWATIAASPALTVSIAKRIEDELCDLDRLGGWQAARIVSALLTNDRAPVSTRLVAFEWAIDQLYWTDGPLEKLAAEGQDQTLLERASGAAIASYRATAPGELNERRECVAILEALAKNPRTPRAALEEISALDHVVLDAALCRNPELPASLYRRAFALSEEVQHGSTVLQAVAAAEWPGDAYSRWKRQPRRLWLDLFWNRMGRRDFTAFPEHTPVNLAQLLGGDVVLHPGYAVDDDDLKRLTGDLGSLLWVPCRLPAAPWPLHYRGFNHGVTEEEAGRFLRQVGTCILSEWRAIEDCYLDACPDVLLQLIEQQGRHAKPTRIQWRAAGEAAHRGIPAAEVAAALGVTVSQLPAPGRRWDERPRWYDAGGRVPDEVSSTLMLKPHMNDKGLVELEWSSSTSSALEELIGEHLAAGLGE